MLQKNTTRTRYRISTRVPSQGCNAASSSSSWPPTSPDVQFQRVQFSAQKHREVNTASIEAGAPTAPNHKTGGYLSSEALLLVGDGRLPRLRLACAAMGRVPAAAGARLLLPLGPVPSHLNLRPRLGLPLRVVVALALPRAPEIAAAAAAGHRARRSLVLRRCGGDRERGRAKRRGFFPKPDRA